MKKIAIGIVGAQNEAHSIHMQNLLRERGAEVVIVDTLQYPENATLSVTRGDVFYNGKSLRSIHVFYMRAIFYSYPPYDLEKRRHETEIDLGNWYVEYMAERERQSHLTSFLRIEAAKGKQVINPVSSLDTHYLKPYQIYLFENRGIPVPKTLVTNDPQRLLEFVKKNKRVVYKPVAGGAPCQRLTDKDLTGARLKRLRAAPVLFQELVEGDPIRVYAIGAKIVSSHRIRAESLDYRESPQEIVPVTLPAGIQKMCLEAMRVCGMKYSGIDLIRKSSGNYVVLECNPSPMFLGMVQTTGVPIDRYFADYLIRLARGVA